MPTIPVPPIAATQAVSLPLLGRMNKAPISSPVNILSPTVILPAETCIGESESSLFHAEFVLELP